jgi:nanoRNase/pAp phosphatase (c-di-AMP/oligoRNAs hydrolase)
LSLSFASLAFNLNNLRTPELSRFVIEIKGLKTNNNTLSNKEDLIAKLSGLIAAIVFGVISEKIRITSVSMTEPKSTFPPK